MYGSMNPRNGHWASTINKVQGTNH